MFINYYEFGKAEPVNELERYSKLEGVDYQYLVTCIKSKSNGFCKDSVNDRKPVKKLIGFSFQTEKGNGVC